MFFLFCSGLSRCRLSAPFSPRAQEERNATSAPDSSLRGAGRGYGGGEGVASCSFELAGRLQTRGQRAREQSGEINNETGDGRHPATRSGLFKEEEEEMEQGEEEEEEGGRDAKKTRGKIEG